MKKLDVNKMGLQAMTHNEMAEINGGVWYEVGKQVVKWALQGAAWEYTKDAVSKAGNVLSHYKHDSTVNYTPWAGPMGGGAK